MTRGVGNESCTSGVLDSDWPETWVKSVKMVSVGALPASLDTSVTHCSARLPVLVAPASGAVPACNDS